MFGSIDCPSCDKPNSVSASYCEYCGATLLPESDPIEESPARPEPRQPVSANQVLGIFARGEEPVQAAKPEARTSSTQPSSFNQVGTSVGKLVAALRTSPTQPSSINQAQGITAKGGGAAQSSTPGARTTQVMTRYRDGYRHARAIDGFGGVIKVVALIIGGLLALGGFNLFGGSGNSEIAIGLGIGIIVMGILIGGIGYIANQ